MAERCASSEGETTRMPLSSAQWSTGSCSVRAYRAMSSTPSSASMPTDVVMPWKSWNGSVTISRRRAAGPAPAPVGAVPVGELDERDGQHAHARVVQALDEIVLVGPAFAGARGKLDLDPLFLEQQPRVHVGGELAIGHEHHVAGLERQGARREVQPVTGVGGERDLGGLRVEQPGDRHARRLQPGLLLAVREEVRGGAFGGELVEHAAGALRDGPDGRVVQIDGVRRPWELRRPQRAELVAQGAQARRVIRDVGHARTSSASRKPSPMRLTASTVRPIASPGKSETHGATRSRSRPSATIAPQEGVGGGAPNPTNESAASAMIAPPTPRVAATITGLRTLGSTWRAASRASEAPSARAAWT